MEFGKRIERNVGSSLEMAGVEISRDLAWDLHLKIDCMIDAIDGRVVEGGLGLQVSMQDDLIKARLSKLLALTRCSYFLYLLVKNPDVFRHPSVRAGAELKQIIINLLPRLEEHPAMAIEIGQAVQIASI